MRNLLFLACYLLPAAALGFLLPQWLSFLDRGVAIGVAVTLLLGGGLLHEVRARLYGDRLRGQQLVELRQALFHLQDELTWARRENRALAEAVEAVVRSGRAGRPGQGGRAIEEVMAEIKALKSLVQQPAAAPARPLPAPPDAAEPEAPEPPRKEPARAKPRKGPPPVVLEPLPREVDEASVLDTVRAALRDDRVELALQPIVSLPQRKICHVECFSRLRDPAGTLVLPERYIALAEREGLITAIDNMLLLRCVQLVRQVQRRGDRSGFFCNISPHTLKDAEFFEDFVGFLDANPDLAPALVFEFTQADLARQGPAEIRNLSRLAMLGCRFSVDQVEDMDLDLGALRRGHIAFVKVEAAKLLAASEEDARVPQLLRRALVREGIDLVVEKLEDEATLRELLDFEIDFGQGFLFGEPRALEAA